MSTRRQRRVGVAVLLLVLGGSLPRAAHAAIMLPGFDLMDPLPGTLVFLPGPGLVPFVGVPLGTFDFGGGPVATGTADTIFHRPIAGAPSSSIPVELLAMQMVSAVPIDLGFGSALHYLTLQAGPPSGGTMTFDDFSLGNHGPPPPPHGFVTYDVDWFFDVHMGALGGPVVFSSTKTLATGPLPWSHFLPGAFHIPGVNFELCGPGDGSCDFFVLGTFAFTAPDGTSIVTKTAPEPTAGVLVLAGLAAVYARMRRRSAVVGPDTLNGER